MGHPLKSFPLKPPISMLALLVGLIIVAAIPWISIGFLKI